MIWAILGLCVAIFIFLVNLRIMRTEKLRLACIEWAVESRAFHGRVYSHPEKTEVVLERAYQYEDFIRSGKPKAPKARMKDHPPASPPPPPPPPPPKK